MIKEKLTDSVIVGGKSVLMTDVFDTLKNLCNELNSLTPDGLSISDSLDNYTPYEGFGPKSREIFIQFEDIEDCYIWVPMTFDDIELDILLIENGGDEEYKLTLENFKDKINIFISMMKLKKKLLK